MIIVKNITKKFGDKVILKGVSCELEEGKSYAIIGKSGAGKTTFLNILSGLEKATSGEVSIEGKKLSDQNLQTLRKEIFGYIFQNYGLIDTETVKENLNVGLANSMLDKQEKNQQMKKILDQIGLQEISLNQKAYTLSGGEQQRVALARAILKRPHIIFADEPTGSLDPENSKSILKHLLNDFGEKATLFMATHDSNVWKKCDYIIEVKNKNIEITKN